MLQLIILVFVIIVVISILLVTASWVYFKKFEASRIASLSKKNTTPKLFIIEYKTGHIIKYALLNSEEFHKINTIIHIHSVSNVKAFDADSFDKSKINSTIAYILFMWKMEGYFDNIDDFNEATQYLFGTATAYNPTKLPV